MILVTGPLEVFVALPAGKLTITSATCNSPVCTLLEWRHKRQIDRWEEITCL